MFFFNKKKPEEKSANVDIFSSIDQEVSFSRKDYLEAYKKNEWVFSAVKLRAETLAETEIILQKDGEDIDDSPALSVLENPNDFTTQYELFEVTSMHLDLVGQAFWYLNKDDGGQPQEIWSLMPTLVTIKKDSKNYISHYEYQNDGQTQRFEIDEIVHFREADPADYYKAVSPLMAAAKTYDLDQTVTEWNKKSIKNGGISNRIISFVDKISEGSFKKWAKIFKKKYTGEKNAGKTVLLDRKVDVHDPSKTQKDMQLIEMSDSNRDKLLGAYRVPKTLLGLTEKVNRATVEGATYNFQRFVNKPRVKRIVQKLNIDFLNQFKNSENLKFSFIDPVPKDKELNIKSRESDSKIGARSINELREQDGLEPITGGESPLLPSTLSSIENILRGISEEKKIEAQRSKKKSLISPKSKKGIEIYLKRFTKEENALRKKYIEIFNTQEKIVLSNIKRKGKKAIVKAINDPEDVLFNKEAQSKKTALAVSPLIFAIVANEGAEALAEIGLDPGAFVIEADFEKAINRNINRFSAEITDTTYDRLIEELRVGLQNEEGIAGLSSRVETVFNQATDFRSRTIARTETLRATNSAFQEAYKQADIEGKEWVAVEDARLRPSHSAANRQVVKINKRFSVGSSKMRFPGDPSAPANETINCRCRIVAAIL